MTKFRLVFSALFTLLLTAVTVVGCSTELAEGTAAAEPATQTVPGTAPAPVSAPTTTSTVAEVTTTTSTAPAPTEPPTTLARPVAPTTTKPQPVVPTTQPVVRVSSSDEEFLACVRYRESRGSYTVVNPSSGAGGAYQFIPSTWRAMGFDSRYGVARAEYAAPWQQDEAARITLAKVGRSPWASSSSPC